VWDAQTGKELLSLKDAAVARSVAFSPDGNRLAAGAADGTVKIWDATPLPEKPSAEEAKKFSSVDLQPKANQKLKDNFAGDEGNSLAGLPTGEQTLEKVKFKIGDGLVQLSSNLWKEEKPERKRPDGVEGIPVGKAFAKLHILHATQYGSLAGVIADDTEIAKYVVHYEGGGTETIPVVYGKDVRNWWFSPEEKGVTRGQVAWKGENEATKKTVDRPEAQRRQIRLYLSTWENPHPTKKVVNIDYVKVGDSPAAPFCVAMTLEEQ
jgi:WD40 repeat protein